MRRQLRIAAAVAVAMLLLTLLASGLLTWTTRRWFEKDLRIRTDLVTRVLADSLSRRWGARAEVEAMLADLVRDPRIVGALACGGDGTELARSGLAPDDFRCLTVVGSELDGDPEAGWRATIGGSPVLATARRIPGPGGATGILVLVHDMSFVEARADSARWLFLGALFLFAVAAAGLTVVVLRVAWQRWTEAVRDLARGKETRPEFQPMLQDVRELVERLTAEHQERETHGPWTPQRLKASLRRQLSGERVLLVANREPYIHQRGPDGQVRVLHPASGLVTALEPVMRACSGVWIAHGSGDADRESSDARGRVPVPPADPAYTLRRVWLSEEEERGYYYGFANEGLWPLCHLADTRPVFRASDWEHYQAINARFAEAVVAEADREDPVVLVQDYHFALVPRLIRERLPRATVISFWHIPWPNAERFGICPQGVQLLEGMLGSSIVGFHTQAHCNNFLDAVDRFLESRLDREEDAVIQSGRRTLVRPYPISIEWPSRWAEGAPPPAESRRAVLARLGARPDSILGVGVDRLDYIKGIEERLLAVERALEKSPELRGRLVFAQVAAPSRTAIEKYRELGDKVEAVAQRVNARFGSGAYRPVVLIREHYEPPAVFELYGAADFVYVSSLHDGMNLVAKEFIAARPDERGTLILSQFTGAARELTEALIVNPHDADQAADAILRAAHMTVEEQAERMRSMRAYVAQFNVYRWAGRMLSDAAAVRERARAVPRRYLTRLAS